MDEFLAEDYTGHAPSSLGAAFADEMFVTDDRAGLTPSQMVDRKLLSLQNPSAPAGLFPEQARQRTIS